MVPHWPKDPLEVESNKRGSCGTIMIIPLQGVQKNFKKFLEKFVLIY